MRGFPTHRQTQVRQKIITRISFYVQRFVGKFSTLSTL